MLLLLIFFFTVNFPNRIQCVTSHSNAADLPPPSALYVLGDSLLDSGNNNLLPTVARANFFPYGANFATGPTGRFTNGRTAVDFIAEFLGLPFAPPYLSLQGSPQAHPSGLNYASGSCGILRQTGKYLGQCLSLAEQIDLLQLTIDFQLPKILGSKANLTNYLSTSIFVISIGSNDYINNYLQPFYGTRDRYSPRLFARHLIATLSKQLQRLYKLGARKMLVFEVGPIGCIPSVTRKTKHKGKCAEEINGLATLFNHRLSWMLKNLSSTLLGSQFTLGRTHQLAYDAIINPSTFGLKDVNNPCCTTWSNGTSACIPGLVPCRHPDQHFFWDGFHLTEAVYKSIAERCIHDSSICSPMSIKELVQV